MFNYADEGGEEFKCYMIWQMMVAMLHSQRDGDTKDVNNVLYRRPPMMTMMILHCDHGVAMLSPVYVDR